MFPALWIMTFKPARVKTEGSFTAEDPWNQNQRTSFTIEAYILAPKGAKPKAGTTTVGTNLYGIRSEVDGVEHMLPESLAHLWRKNRIPAEALPRLLKEMGPMLKKTDFRFQVLTKVYTVMQYVVTSLFALLLLGLAAVIGFSGFSAADMVTGVIIVAVMGLFCAGVLYLMFFRPRSRRRRQMDWALAHL
jgi:hypothetical protein